MFSTCMRDCYDTCLMESWVESGKLIVRGSLKNPITDGFLCPKGQMFPKWVHSEERLKNPLLRREGNLVSVSWEEAIEVVAGKMKELVRKGKQGRILLYQYAGDRGVVNYHFPMRLFHKIGATFLDHGICDRAGREALRDIYGTAVGLKPEELRGRNLIVYWGMNPFWTNLHGFQYIKRLGLEVWTVDVYRTQTVKRSDRAFLIRPGTDPEFAAAVLKVMMERGYCDERAKGMDGFEDLKRSLEGLDLERLTSMSGVKVEEVELFAKEFHEKRGVVHFGYGFQRGVRGGRGMTLAALIPLLSSGDCSFMYDMKVLRKDYAEGAFLREGEVKKIPQMLLEDYIERGEVEMIYVYNSNPLETLPNARRLKELIRGREVFLVTHDIFLTETARHSNVVLPANTFFERFDIADSYYHAYVSVNEPLLRVAGKGNREVAMMIAERMGLDDPYLYESEESIIRRVLEDSGLSFEELMERKIVKGKKLEECKPERARLFTEKVKKSLEDLGNVPKGRFLMITPTYQMTISSQYHNTYGLADPFLHISPYDAEELGLKDGDEVRIRSASEVVARVRIDPDVPKGLVVGYKAFWKELAGWNVNEVVPKAVQSEYGNASVYHHFEVEIEGVR